ncbi:hypothetical protein OSB04_019833 [Centaurea solstitialis]|uniref:HAT C-terminal dimerisation domain-containing protein n=1 Tax=Centaurea solstitialis TaxID=347529 RepID=A0AA38SR29_9ASTR|nr:hypothetical protein OSB04_019833 [Centaurea solstitialis]
MEGNNSVVMESKLKNILVIQILMVASDSAFSTSRRILDPYRTSMPTPTVEVLFAPKIGITMFRGSISSKPDKEDCFGLIFEYQGSISSKPENPSWPCLKVRIGLGEIPSQTTRISRVGLKTSPTRTSDCPSRTW